MKNCRPQSAMPLQKSAPEPDCGNGNNNYREIISAIAVEIQQYIASFTAETTVDKGSVCADQLSTKLRTEQLQLKIKKNEITKLKKQIRSACVVAKTIISSKETETQRLSTLLNSAKNEIILLQDHINMKQEVIKKLCVDNQDLGDKLESLTNFIDLGYGEILKITGENYQDIPVTFELRKIIVSCGKYYADFHIERQKNLCQHQRNLFLSNRLSTLETILEANVRELHGLREQNLSLQAVNAFIKRKMKKTCDKKKSCGDNNYDDNVDVRDASTSLTDIQRDVSFMNNELSDMKVRFESITCDKTKKYFKECKVECDEHFTKTENPLDRHVTAVSNLLKDQDFMLQELKRISLELYTETKINSLYTKNKTPSKTDVFNCGSGEHSSNTVHPKYLKSFFEDRAMLDCDQSAFYNIFQGTRDLAQNYRQSFQISRPKSQLWCDHTYELFRRTSNTTVLHTKKDDRDDKSTCCGITSEMQQIMDGCVASKIKAFENISLDRHDLKRSSSASSTCKVNRDIIF